MITICQKLIEHFSDDIDGVCIDSSNCSNSTNSTLLYFQPRLNPNSSDWYKPLIWSFGGVHIILSIWMLLMYYVKHWPNIRFEIMIIKKYM